MYMSRSTDARHVAEGALSNMNDADKALLRDLINRQLGETSISQDDAAITMASARGAYNGGIEEAKRQRDNYKAQLIELLSLVRSIHDKYIGIAETARNQNEIDQQFLQDMLDK